MEDVAKKGANTKICDLKNKHVVTKKHERARKDGGWNNIGNHKKLGLWARINSAAACARENYEIQIKKSSQHLSGETRLVSSWWGPLGAARQWVRVSFQGAVTTRRTLRSSGRSHLEESALLGCVGAWWSPSISRSNTPGRFSLRLKCSAHTPCRRTISKWPRSLPRIMLYWTYLCKSKSKSDKNDNINKNMSKWLFLQKYRQQY